MSEENKKLALDYVDAFNRGDEITLRTLFTDDALVYGVLGGDQFRGGRCPPLHR